MDSVDPRLRRKRRRILTRDNHLEGLRQADWVLERTREVLAQAGLTATAIGTFKAPHREKNGKPYSFKIDVGLSENAPESTAWIRHEPDHVHVLGFEPAKKNLATLLAGTSSMKTVIPADWIGRHLFVVPCALGAQGAMSTLYAMDEGGMSSLKKPRRLVMATRMIKASARLAVRDGRRYGLAHGFRVLWSELTWLPNLRVSHEETFVTTLDTVMSLLDESDFPYVTHLKIDAQGGDIDVLQGAKETLKRTIAVTLEPESHQYRDADGNSKVAIEEFMRGQGFVGISEFRTLPQAELIEAQVVDPTFVNVRLWQSLGSPHIWIHQMS